MGIEMRLKSIGFGVCGLYATASFALKDARMSTIATVATSWRFLAFWEKHGLRAAMDHTDVSRSTLYAWQATYREQGATGLAGKRRAA